MQWMPSDSKENYKESGNLYTPESFDYQFNDWGYRCDSFAGPEQYPFRVLFIGCSYTMGIGLPQEETWAYKTLKSLRTHYQQDIPYWNIGFGGVGTDFNARMASMVIPHLKPNLVLFLAPSMSRREIIEEQTHFNAIPPEFMNGMKTPFKHTHWLLLR
jgi:hypothetical protein